MLNLYCVTIGRRWSRQDPAAMAALLHWHARSRLRRRFKRQGPDRRGSSRAASYLERQGDERLSLAGLCKQARYSRRWVPCCPSRCMVMSLTRNVFTAMTPTEVTEKLGLLRMKDRSWYCHPSNALEGDGLFEGWRALAVLQG